MLLVQDDVEVWPAKQEVTGEPDNLFPSKLNSSQPTPADTGARKGLPTGSKTSTMILSRSILCPLIDASPYRDRAVLHGDDVAIAAKGEEEAKDTLHNLRSIFENSPVGPLTVGRHAIRHITERINFAKYGLRQDSYRPGSALEACPSARSYDRFLARAEEKYLDKRASTPTRNAGTPKGRVSTYRKRWPKAFPLWSPTKESLGLLWQSAFDARQNAERRLTQGLVCQDQQQQGDDGDEGE